MFPSATSSNTDFDFIHGKWKIHNRKLKERFKNSREWFEFEAEQECIRILEGNGNMDFFQTTVNSEEFEAITLRLFDPKSKLWSIYWADSKLAVLDVGQGRIVRRRYWRVLCT